MKRPELIWPIGIALLLTAGTLATLGVFVASRSDGGAQVVDDYYRKAAAWDSLAAIERKSRELGWSVRVESFMADSGRFGSISVDDAEGVRVAGLAGTIFLGRPQKAGWLAEHPLREETDQPGIYGFAFPNTDTGIWDVTIDAGSGESRFVKTIRIDI